MARIAIKKEGVFNMRYLLLLLFGAAVFFPRPAFAEVNIFACAPEWGALAQEIGADKVEVYTATKAAQDVHHMRAKPSLLAAMRKADLVLCSGASLEIGWLPILLNKAGDAQVQDGAVGSIMASDYVDRLEMMDNVDRSMGHVHPEGNPHIHLDPRNVLIIAGVLKDRLSQIDSANASGYAANYSAFKTKWNAAMQAWEAKAAALKGANVVVYHNSWSYLLNWLGMNSIASLEPKPGIPPTASHLEKVLNDVGNKQVVGILVAPFENGDAAKWLSEKTNIPTMSLPFTVGGNAQAVDLYSLFDSSISILSQGKVKGE